MSRLDSILPLSRKDLGRQNLVPEGDKYRIQFPEIKKDEQITFLLSLDDFFECYTMVLRMQEYILYLCMCMNKKKARCEKRKFHFHLKNIP